MKWTSATRLLVFVGITVLASCRGASSSPVVVRQGSLILNVRLAPDPPHQKSNTLDITVSNRSGSPLDGAEVSVGYLMPAMGAMPEMKGSAAVTPHGDGRYLAEFDLPTAGGWTLHLRVDTREGSAEANFGLTVGREGLTATDASSIEAGAGGGQLRHSKDDVAHYTCSMHPSVHSETPGTCPICSMDLVPVTREEVETGIITIDAKRRQTIGVTIEPVARRSLTVSVRAVGKVVYDDTRLADVTLKLRGWIGQLYADTPGQRVQRGEPLFTLYSPELYAAQEELLAAAASQKAARSSTAPERADYLVDAARRRLRLWDIEAAQIDRVLRQGKALEYVPISSPVSGYVIEKNVVEGAAVEPGARLYRIAGLDQVWVEAEVYESDLGLIEKGDSVRVTLPYSPGRELQGQVAFVYPYLDDATRTGRVRIELSNPDLALKPDMYANVELDKALGERLVVPEDAILYAGLRSFVFVDLGEGRLRPQAVELGRKAGDFVEIRAGLAEGDSVVTSGNFLVAAESRLKRDMEHWQ